MKLRMKILSGFLILVLMLAIAGIFSIYELTSISHSVQKLLDDNYKSIDAAKKMIEALEREDSALLLFTSGELAKGQQTLTEANANFQAALDTARNNLTIPNELSIVENIDREYKAYEALWADPANNVYTLDWYFGTGHKSFQSTKAAVDALIALNDSNMYQTATDLQNRMHRIIMPGIVAIVAALVFAFIFNYFINHYFINPLISITKEVQKVLKTGNPANIEIETNDELKDLASAVTSLSGLVPKIK